MMWRTCDFKCISVAIGVLIMFSSSGTVGVEAQNPEYDILIKDGSVVDGTGNPAVRADVGIRDGRVVAVGQLEEGGADRTIDAEGLHVAPGFIDLHPHAHRALMHDDEKARQAYSLHHQGLTTIAGGADGRTPSLSIEDQVESYLDPGTTMNVAPMVGHNTIRGEVMGEDFERLATEDEVAAMAELVREGLESGAFGLTAGLEYDPGRYSDTGEVIALSEVVADYDGFYIAHQRSEPTMPMWAVPSEMEGWPIDGQQALEETIEVARETGIRVVASHHKARGRASFGRSAYDTVIVNEARADGLQVYLDVYPYETYGGGPRSMLPRWALENEDGEIVENGTRALEERWNNPETRALIERDIEWEVNHNGGPGRVYVLDHPDENLVNRTLEDIAESRDLSYTELVVELHQTGFEDRIGGAVLRGYGIHNVDIDNYYRQDYTAMASDAGVSVRDGVCDLEPEVGDHPRHWGAFVRYISEYVKNRNVLPLSQAIRALTGLPAQIMGLDDRGYIKSGYHADVVVFDYDRLQDNATIFEPAVPSDGVEYVLVNGTVTIERGDHTGALPGVVLRRDGASHDVANQ